MTTPDITGYTDLTVEEKTAQDLIDKALERLALRAPDYAPRETGLEMVLLETLAEMVEESIFAINRLPGAIFESLLDTFGVTRFMGTAPTVGLLFTISTPNGYTVPAGTRVALTSDVGTLAFALDAEVVIAAGTFTGTGAATAEGLTSEFDGTPSGTDLSLLDAVPFVDYVRTSSVVVGGADPETDEEYLARGTTRFSRLNETLVLTEHFVAMAQEDPLVKRAYALDNYDPATGGVGSAAGHVAVAVYGDGRLLTAVEKEALRARMAETTLASLSLHIIDPTITDVDITVTIERDGYLDTESTAIEAEAALRAYIDPTSWPWSGTIWQYEIVGLLANTIGVRRVVSLTAPDGDLTLTGVAPLARVGTVSVTVSN